MLHRGAMIGSVSWGAFCLLLLKTAAMVSPPQDKQIEFQHVRQERRGEDVDDEQALVLDKSMAKQRQEQLDKPTSFLLGLLAPLRDTPHDINKDSGGPKGAQERRVLQSTCNVGDPFTISSSAFPLIEGCFSDLGLGTEDGRILYQSDPFAVASFQVPNTTTNETLGSFWYVVELTSDNSVVEFYCISMENSTALPHPAGATWLCDVNGDGQLSLPSSSEFSTTCSCSTTTEVTTDIDTSTTTTDIDTTTTTTDIDTSTTTTDIDTTTTTTDIDTTTTTTDIDTTTTTTDIDTTTTTTDIDTTTTTTDIDTTTTTTDIDSTTTTTTDIDITTTTIDSESATCDEGESLTISSTVVPDLAGCYLDTGYFEEGEVIYSEIGVVEDQHNLIIAVDFEEDSATDIHWVVEFIASTTTTEENALRCISLDQADRVHPVDVEQWFCFSDSADSVESLTTGEFSVSCGCSSDTEGEGQEADIGSLSAPLLTLITFRVGFMATAILLAGI